MNLFKRLPLYLLLLALISISIWSIFFPKEDFVDRVSKTLSEQKEREDLFFSGVTVAEILDGIKFWELNAKTSSLNKTTNITNLGDVYGTFFQNGKATLKILAPDAIWNMSRKEIYMKDPIGYDTKFEKIYGGRVNELRTLKNPRAVFNLPATGSLSEAGYWFKAHNLNWGLTTKKIICRDGILLTKGNLAVESKMLEADIAMEHVTLIGSPRAMFDDVTLEATTIEVDSPNDLVYANGRVVMTRPDGKITSDRGLYRQRTSEVEFRGDVKVVYRDLNAWGDVATYDISNEVATLAGRAKAIRADNTLAGREIRIFFKENRVTVKGQTKIKVTNEQLNQQP